MTFKDTLQDDLDNVFFNLDEFSETHNYNGVDINVILDDDKLSELEMDKNEHSDGLYGGSKLIYVKQSDIKEEPFIGQYVTFDNATYCVNSVKTPNGIYAIILGDNES